MQDKWPFPPSVLDTTFFLGASTTSTAGAVLWGGGTTKPMGFGPGLIIVTGHFRVEQSGGGDFGSFQLQTSVDGAAWTDRDPGGARPWYDNRIDRGGESFEVSIVFNYLKTTSAQEYARIRWRTSAGTFSLTAPTGTGQGSAVRMYKLPTWTAP